MASLVRSKGYSFMFSRSPEACNMIGSMVQPLCNMLYHTNPKPCPRMPVSKDLIPRQPPGRSKVETTRWQETNRMDYRWHSEHRRPAFNDTGTMSQRDSSANVARGLDYFHYKPQKLSERTYSRTWNEFPSQPNPPRHRRTENNNKLDLGLFDPEEFLGRKTANNPSSQSKMPNTPPKKSIVPPIPKHPIRSGSCERPKAKYPSFSEFCRNPFPKPPPLETTCLKPSICDSWCNFNYGYIPKIVRN
ncbi:uncharacterized protein LOC110182495 [Drosophila serrata]|uniref:uncharacterized protein LOC110182495 n=1 Tax=Drosophila serrata TaxID=7274 RepID=UPI000A1D100E|nr:uncharacterized protein LOC110182495 [Drosophila serrata]